MSYVILLFNKLSARILSQPPEEGNILLKKGASHAR